MTAEVNALKTSAATKAELSALESKVVTIAALNAYKTQVTTDIAAAVAGLATKASVDAVNVEVVKVQTALSALGVSVDAKILALKTELNAKDAELATAIGAVTARVATLEGLVAANTTGVADNKAAIVALQAELTALKTQDIATINAKLAALDADLKKLGTDLKLDFEVLATRQLDGLLFVPEFVIDGFNQVEVGYILDKATPAEKALFEQKNVIFRFNPTTADLTGIIWKFINNQATFNAPGLSAAPGDASTLFAAPALTNNNDGSGSFSLKVGTWSEPAPGKTHYFALQSNKVVGAATSSVVSDYVKVATTQYSAYITKTGTAFLPFANPNGVTSPANTNNIDVNIVYNNPNVNLNNLVVAAGAKGLGLPTATLKDLGFGELNVDYKFQFDSVTNYIGTDLVTKQSHFLTWNAAGDVQVKGGVSAINRVPVVKVSLLSKDNKVLAVSYIKFKINATELVKPTPKTFAYTLNDINYQTMFNGAATVDQDLTLIGGITWPQMNLIYTQLGIDHNKFLQIYGPLSLGSGITASGKYGSTAYTAAQLPQLPAVTTQVAKLNVTLNQPNVDTYAFSLEANPLSKFGANEFAFVLTPSVADQANYPVITLKFNYNVVAPNVVKALLPAWQDPTGSTNATTQGTNAGGEYKMQMYLGEPFGYGDAKNALKAIFSATRVNDKIDAKHELIVSEYVTPAPTVQSYIVTGNGQTTDIDVLLGSGTGNGTLLKLANAITTTRVYPVNFKTTYPNNEVNNFNFTITFKNPLEIALATDASFVLTDKQDATADSKNIALNYVVKFLGTTIVDKGTTVSNTFGLNNSGLGYTLTGITNDYQLVSLSGSTVTWSNQNGAYLVQKIDVANANVTYTASNTEGAYAIQKRTDVVSVKPYNQ